MAKNNFITALQKQGFIVTSDPNNYWDNYTIPSGKRKFGDRRLYQYGVHADAFCNGMHPAHDMASYHDAPVKSPVNATVLNGTGWNTFGWTLVLGFIDAKGIKRQVIIGHLNRNPLTYLKVGQNVKKGQVVAYQGASNTLGVTMASHLHIQMQPYKALGEWEFTCTGIDATKVDITTTKPVVGSTPNKASKPKTQASKKVTPSNWSKRKGRKTRSKPYAIGIVRNKDGLGAGQRLWSGGKFTNRLWPDIYEGETVYIYATTKDGWARIYSPSHKGWIYLDRVQITQVFD